MSLPGGAHFNIAAVAYDHVFSVAFFCTFINDVSKIDNCFDLLTAEV